MGMIVSGAVLSHEGAAIVGTLLLSRLVSMFEDNHFIGLPDVSLPLRSALSLCRDVVRHAFDKNGVS